MCRAWQEGPRRPSIGNLDCTFVKYEVVFRCAKKWGGALLSLPSLCLKEQLWKNVFTDKSYNGFALYLRHALQKKLKKQTQIRVSDKTWRESGRRWNERIARGFWRVHWWSWLTPATAQMWSSPLSKSNDRKDFFSKLNGFCRYLLFRPLKVALFFKWDLRDLKTIFKKHIHTFHSKHLSSTNATSSGFGTWGFERDKIR